MPKLLYLITEDWFFCSHFIERAMAARHAGFDVVVVAREGALAARIRDAGLRFVPLDISRRSLNPLREIATLLKIFKIYRQERPDIVHQIAVKPILYGSLAARLLGIGAIVNAPVGMGYAFSSSDMTARLLRPLINFGYRALINPPGSFVVFENKDDLNCFAENGMVRRQGAVLIRGAGVDLKRFHPAPQPDGVPVVVLVSRMLRDKGVFEFAAAAEIVNRKEVIARFLLVGDPDSENPASIPPETLYGWHGRFGIEWLGRRDDVDVILGRAHIACLPSYREGLPKALLEAAASGLPIVTTDTTGCREVVIEGENGFLVPVKDAKGLATAIEKLVLDRAMRMRMGQCSRRLAESEFSSEIVIGQTLSLYEAQTKCSS